MTGACRRCGQEVTLVQEERRHDAVRRLLAALCPSCQKSFTAWFYSEHDQQA